MHLSSTPEPSCVIGWQSDSPVCYTWTQLCDWLTVWLTFVRLCDWLTVWLTWVCRRTSWSWYPGCCRSVAGSVRWPTSLPRNNRSLEDGVRASRAADRADVPADDRHSSTVSARTLMSAARPMWQCVTVVMSWLLLLLLLILLLLLMQLLLMLLITWHLVMVCITTALWQHTNDPEKLHFTRTVLRLHSSLWREMCVTLKGVFFCTICRDRDQDRGSIPQDQGQAKTQGSWPILLTILSLFWKEGNKQAWNGRRLNHGYMMFTCHAAAVRSLRT